MRRLLVLTLLAGCGATPPPAAPPPPVVAPAQAIVSLALPGGPAATWPTAAPFAGGRYLLPYRDDHGLHVRLIGDAGDVDVDLGAGELLGAAARGDGFVVASALGATIEIHFLDGELRLQVERIRDVEGRIQSDSGRAHDNAFGAQRGYEPEAGNYEDELDTPDEDEHARMTGADAAAPAEEPELEAQTVKPKKRGTPARKGASR